MMHVETLPHKTLDDLKASMSKGYYEYRIMDTAVVLAESGSDTVKWWDLKNGEAYALRVVKIEALEDLGLWSAALEKAKDND